jgi:hypothetical protein
MLWNIVLAEEASFIITLSLGIYGDIESVNINIDVVWVVYWYFRRNWNEVGLIKKIRLNRCKDFLMATLRSLTYNIVLHMYPVDFSLRFTRKWNFIIHVIYYFLNIYSFSMSYN